MTLRIPVTTALLCAVVVCARPSAAQSGQHTAADSAIIGRILLAEDRRDSTDVALRLAASHPNERIRVLAKRATMRIRSPIFAGRDSLPPLAAPPKWPEPAWRLRYRAIADRRDDCQAIRMALADESWPVRLRAADLVRESCASDHLIASTLRGWIDSLPQDLSRRKQGEVSWHAAAHALVALARLTPDSATPLVRRLAQHGNWHLRHYAARAAAVLADTATLRAFAVDSAPNVREASIEALSALTKHESDEVYIQALGSDHPQVVRVAALALVGSQLPSARSAAAAAFERWVARANASERDVRAALLAAAGRDTSQDRPPKAEYRLPPEIVALALGKDVRLRVTMSPASGGGSFIVRLRGDVAPMTAARILELAKSGYYDGLTWHRVEHDFVIQGGSPGENEYVGLKQYFRDELGTVPHVRGTVGMSTRGHDTGDAQWFINLKDNLRLNRDYTLFGEVIEGIETVDQVMEGDVIASIRPIE